MNLSRIIVSSLFVFIILISKAYCEGTSRENINNSLIETFDFRELPEQIQGCSCLFHAVSSSDRLVFASDMGRKIWMKLDGKFALLTLKESKFHAIGALMTKKLGSKLNYVYSSGEITINIELETTSVCPPNSESCEAQSSKATFTAIKGYLKQTVVTTGICGC
jgi:hypothetical protein